MGSAGAPKPQDPGANSLPGMTFLPPRSLLTPDGCDRAPSCPPSVRPGRSLQAPGSDPPAPGPAATLTHPLARAGLGRGRPAEEGGARREEEVLGVLLQAAVAAAHAAAGARSPDRPADRPIARPAADAPARPAPLPAPGSRRRAPRRAGPDRSSRHAPPRQPASGHAHRRPWTRPFGLWTHPPDVLAAPTRPWIHPSGDVATPIWFLATPTWRLLYAALGLGGPGSGGSRSSARPAPAGHAHRCSGHAHSILRTRPSGYLDTPPTSWTLPSGLWTRPSALATRPPRF